MYTFHHFHSIAHEVLGIARGEVRVLLGGPSGRKITARVGDVLVIPAGVAHRNMGQSADLLVDGAYPGGGTFDLLCADPAEFDQARRNVAAVPLPDLDPVPGLHALHRLWGAR
ncbi:MAG: cupin domain-containing protein [Janthinobacterium lividum]